LSAGRADFVMVPARRSYGGGHRDPRSPRS
jgi:hypothetical protein